MIAAIIPAAGRSQRMGEPKALLPYRGATFLETILQACRALGLNRRIVVLGRDKDQIARAMDLSGETVLLNPDPASGPLRSVQLAIRQILDHPVEAALVWHVDRPHVGIATAQAMIDRFREGGAAIVVPAYSGKRGHPVLFARAVFEELLTTPASHGARRVVRADPGRVATAPVNDRAVCEDIDTPEDYATLLRQVDPRPTE
ncbi:MAG: nucleotidyltransferase family protein [Gemmatimonadota bacterium]|nr:nucleotidyltransferase family protein [Gemmatimonadota bacterium]MDH3368363.1 nucleotidyltransferase family protein [Gemmatimonadota bacterium]MDH3476941.1 nucleotidyltransferase family protein [Gemmatimonadota bacterium]MDH3569222.1 nucleotidyltransferase family protein [Gemmatimonadota bacterium]